MTADEHNIWPIPAFRFEVDFGGELKEVGFQEVSGMDKDIEPIDYHPNTGGLISPRRLPGANKYGTIIMKRGMVSDNDNFVKWADQIKFNNVKPSMVLIKLLDEAGKITMQWKVANAYPTKVRLADLKANTNEIAIESLELAYEQLEVVNR